MKFSYNAPGPQLGLLWLGDTAGLFKQNNLDVEIIYMPGNIPAPSLMAGEIRANDQRADVANSAAMR